MPCGACVVDFFITTEGEGRWLIPGDATRYTRRSVIVGRHGDEPWRRLLTLEEAAAQLGHHPL